MCLYIILYCAEGALSIISDLLDKFPPNSVEMKQPLCVQPWESSPEIVSKLFKVRRQSDNGTSCYLFLSFHVGSWWMKLRLLNNGTSIVKFYGNVSIDTTTKIPRGRNGYQGGCPK